MELDKIIGKRIKGMAVRILARFEHTLASDLDVVNDSDRFVLEGSDLKMLRSEILNAAGDTTRSLATLVQKEPDIVQGKLSLTREMIHVINGAKIGFVTHKDEDIPIFQIQGEFNLLNKIRDLIKSGIVYNNKYTCVGVDSIIDLLIPFMDKVQFMGIKIANGEYKTWRDEVCDIYLEDLSDD